MRMRPFAKRFIALSLCAGLILTGTGGTTASQADINEPIMDEASNDSDTSNEAAVQTNSNADTPTSGDAQGLKTDADASDAGASDAGSNTGANVDGADKQDPLADQKELTGEKTGSEDSTLKEKTGSEDSTLKEETEHKEESDEDPKPLIYEDEKVCITVRAAKGVIPENAILCVTPIEEKTDKSETEALTAAANVITYQDIETKLAENAAEKESQLLGFLAYDISFVDNKGVEVKPKGDVTVSMEYVNPVLPEGVENVSDIAGAEVTEVTVMHLEENEKGEIEKVVDLSAEEKIKTLTTTEEKKIEKAEFVSNQFSPFTITWWYNAVFSPNDQAVANLKFYYVDEKENRLMGAGDPDPISYSGNILYADTTVIFENKFGDSVSGYGYDGAYYYKDEKTIISVEKVKCTRPIGDVGENYYIIFDDDNEKVFYVDDNKIPELYLVYKPTPGSMTVSNTVAGVESSENLSYTFTIQKDNTPVSGAFCTIFDGGKNDAKSETTSSEGTFTLKDGEYAVISGLEDGTYTVTETGVSDSTDTNSYTLDNNFTTYVTTSTGTSGAGAQTTTARSATVDVAQADTETPKVHFLNDFKSTADTGTGTATSVSLENAISVQPHTVKAADGTETEAADGTYDLTFTVKGKKGITTDRINADIVFVTDGSDDQQEAADALVQYFKDRTELVNSRFAVVNTKTGQAVKQSEDAYWTDSGSIIYSDGSTGTAEYQTAITAASQLLVDDAENVKVLICLDDSGTIDKPAGIDHIYTGTDIQPSAIFEEVRTVDCKNVMVENILSRYAEWSTGENLSLTLTVMDDNGKDISTTSASTSGKDSSTASGTPIAIASVVIGEKTITASYVVSNGQQKIVLEIPDHLQENYTYAVTARIEPTEAAYKYYMEHGSYARNADGTLIVGGTGTGLTSANANGFYVNQQAAVTYSVGGVEKTAAYENPVIQLQTVYRWNIFKVSANNYDYGLAGAAFTLVPTDGSGTTYYATSGDGTSGEAGKLTWYTDDHYQKAANYIAPGTYTLTETAAPAGYLVSNVEWTIIVGKDNDIQIKKDGETINPDAASAAKQVITKTKTESEGSPAVVTYAIKFENEILYSLPSAGGEGIFRYLIAGMLLMMCGALLIFAKRRKILRI